MMRKLFWMLTMLSAACVVSGLLDRRRAEQRRELWAEATD